MKKQGVSSCDLDNDLDQVRDNGDVDLLVKFTFVVAVVAMVQSFHREQRRWNRVGNGEGHIVSCNGRALHVFKRDPMVLRD